MTLNITLDKYIEKYGDQAYHQAIADTTIATQLGDKKGAAAFAEFAQQLLQRGYHKHPKKDFNEKGPTIVMNPNDFIDTQGKPLPQPDCTCFVEAPMLQHLWGLPWNKLALCWVYGLRPEKLRVTFGATTTDCCVNRVTVYLQEKLDPDDEAEEPIIERIVQSLAVAGSSDFSTAEGIGIGCSGQELMEHTVQAMHDKGFDEYDELRWPQHRPKLDVPVASLKQLFQAFQSDQLEEDTQLVIDNDLFYCYSGSHLVYNGNDIHALLLEALELAGIPSQEAPVALPDKLTSLEKLRKLFREGKLRGAKLQIDNDETLLYVKDQCVFRSGGPSDIIYEALDLLGIEWEHA